MDDTKLPPIPRTVVDAITKHLMVETGCLRPPEKAAALLALCIGLHKEHIPFPRREVAARLIGASISTVDAALSTRLADGYLTLEMETEEGSVERRASVVRKRYYVPSSDIIQIADEVARREAAVYEFKNRPKKAKTTSEGARRPRRPR